MANDFDAVMLKRTDADLMKILNSPAGDYQPAALESAKRELDRRDLSLDEKTFAERAIRQDQESAISQANEPLGILAKLVALFFPGILLIIFSFTFKAEGYDRKAKELRRWTLYGVFLYTGIIILESILASL